MAGKHTFQLRRGLKSELDQILLAIGELGFTTDTGEVWIGTGNSNILCGRALVGKRVSRPAPGIPGRIYDATDENTTYIDNGTSWRSMGVSSMDLISDGSTYGRVRITELNAGRVQRIQAVLANAYVSGDDLRTHIMNGAKHREINDAEVSALVLWSAQKIDATKADKVAGAVTNNIASLDVNGNLQDSGLRHSDTGLGTSDIWSANKINNEINSRLTGIAWRNPASVFSLISDEDMGGVIPSNPVLGDAYVVNNWGSYTDGEIREWDGTIWIAITTIDVGTRAVIKSSGAAGSFLNHGSHIAEYYGGGSWVFSEPAEGWAILIDGDNSVYEHNGYVYSNGTWVQFTGAGQINAGVGLAKIGNTLDINLGAGISELPTDEVGIDVQANQGLKLTSLAADGQLAVDYDNLSLGIVNNKLSVKAQGITADKIAAAVAGDGLTGGSGIPLSVSSGPGLQIVNGQLLVKAQPLGAIEVDANGLAVNVDGVGLTIIDNMLKMNVIDGGSFVEVAAETIWYSCEPMDTYWLYSNNAVWDSSGSFFYNDELGAYQLAAISNWQVSYRPTKMRLTYAGGTIVSIRFLNYFSDVIQLISGPISSGQELDLIDWGEDFTKIEIEVTEANQLYMIEFDTVIPEPVIQG